MTRDSLHERGQAMEEAFFHDVDKRLLEQMKSRLQADEERKHLANVTGIGDESVLNDLLEQGITAETLASVGLIPLIAVAWADGKMEPRERDAVLRAAREIGISDDHSGLAVVAAWLNKQPGPELLAAWKEYVGALRKSLDAASMEQVKNSVIGRARKVAESAGGFMGIVNTVDPAEKEILQQLNDVFE